MSARDSESGSSSYKGGSGRAGGLGNGGIGGGMGGGGNYGGGMGGGAGRMGGIGSRTGLTTGNQMFGGMAFGRPGGNAMNSSAWGVRPQAGVTRGPLNPGLLGNPAPASVPGVNPAVEQEMALPTNPPSFVNNPFVDKPATIADYVRSVVKSYQGLNAPAAEPVGAAWTPAAATNPAIQSVPGYANVHRGFSGSNWQNNSAGWPRQGVPGTRSLNTTNGGYPSLGSQDTRPAGVY